jgi:hypothetical protein
MKHRRIIQGEKARAQMPAHFHLNLPRDGYKNLYINLEPTCVLQGIAALGRRKGVENPSICWVMEGAPWHQEPLAFMVRPDADRIIRFIANQDHSTMELILKTGRADPRKRISELRAIGVCVASWTDVEDDEKPDHGDDKGATVRSSPKRYKLAGQLYRITFDEFVKYRSLTNVLLDQYVTEAELDAEIRAGFFAYQRYVDNLLAIHANLVATKGASK